MVNVGAVRNGERWLPCSSAAGHVYRVQLNALVRTRREEPSPKSRPPGNRYAGFYRAPFGVSPACRGGGMAGGGAPFADLEVGVLVSCRREVWTKPRYWPDCDEAWQYQRHTLRWPARRVSLGFMRARAGAFRVESRPLC